MIMEFEVYKRHILRPALSIVITERVMRWERQNSCSNSKRQRPMTEKYYYQKYYCKPNWGRQDEDKRRQINGKSWIYFKIAPFGHILRKLTRSHLGAWSFLLVHILFTPSEGPKGFCKVILQKQDHEVGPWRRVTSHGPTSWSMV